MIEVTELRKRYGATQSLDGMTFRVLPGQVTGFVGPNGAGKSTTMRIILGLDAADAGTALIGGRPYRTLRRPLSHVGRAARRGRAAAEPVRPQPPALARLLAGPDRPPGRRGHRPGGPALRDPAQGGRLLARHAAAPRHRRRPARRPARAHAGRAVQRHGPRGHHLAARLPARPRRRGPGGAGLQPPDERAAGHRRPPDRGRPGPGHRRHQHARPARGGVRRPGPAAHLGSRRGDRNPGRCGGDGRRGRPPTCC